MGDGGEQKLVPPALRSDADLLRYGELAGGPVGKGMAASSCLLALIRTRNQRRDGFHSTAYACWARYARES